VAGVREHLLAEFRLNAAQLVRREHGALIFGVHADGGEERWFSGIAGHRVTHGACLNERAETAFWQLLVFFPRSLID
jgi:hypothetical protein